MKLDFQFRPIFSEISHYSTAQTSNAVFIIGGWSSHEKSLNIVAEFKENVWRRLADLRQERWHHGSITVGVQTMIIGGYSGSG